MSPVHTAKMTIDFHPEGVQCGDLYVTYTLTIEPINVPAPRWITEAATTRMCADRRHNNEHDSLFVDLVIDAMEDQRLDTVVVLGETRDRIEDAIRLFGYSELEDRLSKLPARGDRPTGHDAAVFTLDDDGETASTTLTTDKEARQAT